MYCANLRLRSAHFSNLRVHSYAGIHTLACGFHSNLWCENAKFPARHVIAAIELCENSAVTCEKVRATHSRHPPNFSYGKCLPVPTTEPSRATFNEVEQAERSQRARVFRFFAFAAVRDMQKTAMGTGTR
jgi:hypothetical protein